MACFRWILQSCRCLGTMGAAAFQGILHVVTAVFFKCCRVLQESSTGSCRSMLGLRSSRNGRFPLNAKKLRRQHFESAA